MQKLAKFLPPKIKKILTNNGEHTIEDEIEKMGKRPELDYEKFQEFIKLLENSNGTPGKSSVFKIHAMIDNLEDHHLQALQR